MPVLPALPYSANLLSSSFASGLFRAQPNGLNVPSLPSFGPITYSIVDWNITISDNICNHVMKPVAYNSSFYIDDMPFVYINQTCGFTRNQEITLAGDNSANNVFQQNGPWGQGHQLALWISKRIEGIWKFSHHYTDSTQQYIDQLTLASQGSQSLGGFSNTVVFSCVGTCTPPVLP